MEQYQLYSEGVETFRNRKGSCALCCCFTGRFRHAQGKSRDWERKIQDPATLVAHARPRRSIPNTHTFFPGLGKSPKAAPSAGTQTLLTRQILSISPSTASDTDSSFTGGLCSSPVRCFGMDFGPWPLEMQRMK
ncbi:hypothetical protein HispidOSU_007192 [Sigmodon hispidus]